MGGTRVKKAVSPMKRTDNTRRQRVAQNTVNGCLSRQRKGKKGELRGTTEQLGRTKFQSRGGFWEKVGGQWDEHTNDSVDHSGGERGGEEGSYPRLRKTRG